MAINKKRIRQTLGIVCAAAVLLTSMAGCKKSSSGTTDDTSISKIGKSSKHVTVSIMTTNYNDTSNIANGEVFKKLQDLCNATINVQWVPGATYTDKFNVLMASGNLPDVVQAGDLKSSVFLDAVNGDQFWQLDPYLKKMENYKNINSISLDNTKINGKHYVLPRERAVKRIFVCYRADWAKKAGIDGAPDTLEKMYTMAKNFAGNDYDGNGKKDTIGLALGTYSDGGGSVIDCLNAMVVANGGANNWYVKNGKVQAMYDTTEYQNTMDWLRKMYSEGLISSDFSITKTSAVQSDLVDKEKTGLFLTYTLPSITDPVYLAQKKTNPSLKRSDVYNYTFLKDSKGNDRIPEESGFASGYAISKKSVKTTSQLADVLSVFNQFLSKDGQNLLNNGIEGREYKVNSDGTCTILDDSLKKKEVGDLNQLFVGSSLAYTVYDDEMGAKFTKEQKTYKKSDLIANASIPLSSEEYSSNSANLNKIIDTAQIKYIMGQITSDQFKSEIKNWKSTGGDKIASEYTASLNGKSTTSSSK